ncbi:MAG: 50S ribosomal protein L6 [Ilumatobacteraceae bacterium]|jgi:large subunit ribosomal protein L6
MSRIGRAPITVPGGVDVAISGREVTVKGPKGTLSRTIPGDISVRRDDAVLVVERPDDERESRSLHGLTRTLVNNMVVGVTDGFTKELEIIGVGYRAEVQGPNKLRMALGFSHPVVVDAPDGITFECPSQTRVIVKGIDKEVVGQVAADIRSIRKPEPYKGKGVRYLGERVQRKAGKTGKK